MDEQTASLRKRALAQGTRFSAAKSDLTILSDLQLMESLRAGEQQALSHLFDRYHRLVLDIASKIVRNRSEAEDIMQEVFFELYRLVSRFDPERGTPKSWIVLFAYRKSLKRRKYLALRGAFDDGPSIKLEEEFSYNPNLYPAHEAAKIVQQAMDSLTPKQKQVIQLACFEGLVLVEIAERINESVGNVRHHYYRGLRKLRDVVKAELQIDTREAAVRR